MFPHEHDLPNGHGFRNETQPKNDPTHPDSYLPEKDIIEPIAIVGLAFKYPQDATSSAAFWKMLLEKRSTMTECPKDRLNIDGFYHPSRGKNGHVYSRGGNFLQEDLGCFDASFFSMTAEEAAAMDPQHRILLETSYMALENAGIPMEKAAGSKTGVYTGTMADDYKFSSTSDLEDLAKYSTTGLATSMLANRVSWFFDFGGPSVNLDSACSSSLIALDMACQGLRNGDSSMAVVAGTSLTQSLEIWIGLSNMGFLSPDSCCYSFDSRANGYVRGEGVGVIIIKKLSDAVRDNDTIRAVIRSTGSNSDGHTPGITQPSSKAQEKLIRETYAKAGLGLDQTRFIEAHGTGTALGDPIEAHAIGSVFRDHRSSDEPLYIGSLKSSIGHLEAGSGIAAIIKTVLVLENGIIPPNANFEAMNPKIDSQFLRIKIPTKVTKWPNQGLRRASCNGFGFGGSNTHCIMEDAFHFLQSRGIQGNHSTIEYPQLPTEIMENSKSTNGYHQEDDKSQKRVEIMPSPKLLVWSSADEDGLVRLSEAYKLHFNSSHTSFSRTYLQDLAYTLICRRSSLSWRSFAIVNGSHDLQGLESKLSVAARASKSQGIAFVFTGQGAQYSKMGLQLIKYPVFSNSLRLAEEALRDLGCTWSILEELSRGKGETNVDDPAYSQPLCTAIQIALVDLLRSFNVQPSAVCGHSSGEIAAAYSIGALSLSSACKVSYFRGKFASALRESSVDNPGAMMSVNITTEKLEVCLSNITALSKPHSITVACINSPRNLTLSGSEADLDTVQLALEARDIFARKIPTGVAYHSPQMFQVSQQYLASIEGLYAAEHRVQDAVMISSVTSENISDPEILRTGDYWIQNLTRPVNFSRAFSHLVSSSQSTKRKLGAARSRSIFDVIEVGPHSALQRPIKDIKESLNLKQDVRYHSVLSRMKDSLTSVLEVAGKLHCLGYNVRLTEVNQLEMVSPIGRKALSDLPQYPFNHSKTYWHEHWTNKRLRTRESLPLELLGTPVKDWNPLEARWRRIHDVLQTPWIQDHTVNGKTIYPAAGMIVMFVEAAKQLSPRAQKIKGFRLHDTTVSSPIVMSEQGGKTETQLYMRPKLNSFDKDCPSFEMRICVRDNDQWKEVGKGTIQIEYEVENTEVDQGREARENTQAYRLKLEQAATECSQSIPKDTFYNFIRKLGLDFGPTFQTLENIAYDGRDGAIAEVNTFDWATYSGEDSVQPHIVHPTTLDATIQLAWAALTKGCSTLIPLTVPTRIKSGWISNSGLSYPETKTLKSFCTSRFQGSRGINTSCFAFDENGNLRLVLNDVESTIVNTNSSTGDDGSVRKLCYGMDWKPDVHSLPPDQILQLCKTPSPTSSSLAEFFGELDLVSAYFTIQALDRINEGDIQNAQPHLQQYIANMQRQCERYKREEFYGKHFLEDENLMRSLIHKVRQSIFGKVHVKVGENLVSVIRGELSPLELLSSNASNLAEEYYHASRNAGTFCHDAGTYVNLLAHKNPGMKILEIGAGNGAFTDAFVPVPLCNEKGTERFHSYDYTDISISFLEKARERFAPLSERINFKALNIEIDPSAQGFESGSYDLILAGSVLHATSNLNSTIQNCRKLLKPGGKLIMLEIVKPELGRCGYVFGLLEGWWLSSEQFRDSGPCVSEELWHNTLTKNGFSGVDFSLHDYDEPICHELSIMVSTATEEVEPLTLPNHILILIDPESSSQKDLARHLTAQIQSTSKSVAQTVSLHDVSSVENAKSAFFIFLPEIERPFLYELDSTEYKTLQHMLSITHNLLWVTRTNEGDRESPKFRMVDGFANVVRNENISRKLITLDLEHVNASEEQWANTIANVLNETLGDPALQEVEYIQRDGILHISRITEDTILDQKVHSQIHPENKDMSIKDAGKISLSILTPGLLSTLCFIPDLDFEKPLASDDLEIEVKFLGLNFHDLLVALGRHPDNNFGFECSGVVTRVGINCSNFKEGDQVAMAKIGCMRTFVRCHQDHAFKIPKSLLPEEAAGVITTGTTIYHSLVKLANIKKGESLLIHSAAGATGQMAIQLAQHIGCEIFVTVGFDNKKKMLMEKYGLKEENIFYSRDQSFAPGIMRRTNNRGVDVVLNSLSSDSLISTWEIVAPYGRFIELGRVDIFANSKLPMAAFAKNVLFAAVAIDEMLIERPQLFQESLIELVSLLENGVLKPPYPLTIMPISKLQDGMRSMQSGRMTGKIVYSISPDDLVPTLLPFKSSWYFDPKSTYLISGGFGGLGRSAALWMATKGARNLILLSRSGPVSKQAAKLLVVLKAMGVSVEAPQCDVSSETQLSLTLSHCAKILPPVRGCVQATMVLQDALFDKMNFDKWFTTINSKVHSTYNLHSLLPNNLDFFITLSSVAGLSGIVGQANYASGNTFQDALCLHRLSIGEKAACLRLGLMGDIGIISENEDFATTRELIISVGDIAVINEKEYLALLEYYCDPARGLLTPKESLPIIGLVATSQLHAKGLEVPYWMQRPTFSPLAQIGLSSSSSTSASSSGAIDYSAQLRATTSFEEAKVIMVDAIATKLSRSLAVPYEDIDSTKPLHAYGVDSLLAVELKNWFGRELQSEIAVFDIIGAESITAMSAVLASRSSAVKVKEDI